ncbi:hypothetical protein [Paenibacillus albidus]|uniref:hypothetical protein n=1 Tax=Paenibacillus albidus TaxID=2041023 RepID=UPI001BE6CEA0|nr:hypothetical protein [Paenibacillus albidus]
MEATGEVSISVNSPDEVSISVNAADESWPHGQRLRETCLLAGIPPANSGITSCLDDLQGITPANVTETPGWGCF